MSVINKILESIKNNQLDQAESYLNQAFDQLSVDQLMELAELLYSMGFYNYLQLLLEQMIEKAQSNDYLYIFMAEIYFEDGNIEESFFWLDQIDSTSPYYSQALLLQADLYLSQGLSEVAEMKLKEGFNLTSHDPVVVFAMAEFYFNMQRYAEGLPYYQRLYESDETFEFLVEGQLSHRIAESYAAMGEWDQAVSYYRYSLEEEEDADKLFQLALVYFQMENYDLAIHYFEKLIDRDPSYSTLYPYLAQAYLKVNEDSRARQLLLDALEYDQQSSQIYHLLAQLSQGHASREEIEAYFNKALALDPFHLETRLDYLEFLYSEGQAEKIIERVQETEDSQLADPHMTYYLALAYWEIEDYERAFKYFEQAFAGLNYSLRFMEDYLLFMREEGRFDLLQKGLDYILDLDPHSGLAKRLKAECEERQMDE